MKKIPTLYLRDPATNRRYVRNEVHPDCGWVAEDGIPTYKWDGTCVRIDEFGIMFKRREVKEGGPIPGGFRQEGDPDPETGKRVGWVAVDLSDPGDRWHLEGLGKLTESWPEGTPWPEGAPGTYELVGPKVQGNPHDLDHHALVPHGYVSIPGCPTAFDELSTWLREMRCLDSGFEGVVWHHRRPDDERMAKIKAKDFPRDD